MEYDEMLIALEKFLRRWGRLRDIESGRVTTVSYGALACFTTTDGTRHWLVIPWVSKHVKAAEAEAIALGERLLTGGCPFENWPKARATRAACKLTFPRGGIPRLWRLFSLCLPHSTRERVFEPLFQEFLEDYQTFRRRCRTKAERWWLAFCFTLKTVGMVGGCLWNWFGQKAACFAMPFLPHLVREWWRMLR
jgi:hypothetical protein